MNAPKIVVLAGSLRVASFNKKLAALAAEAARAAGAEVAVVDIRELDLPLFNQDIEDATGLPAGAKKLKALLRDCDGFLIASPEYNSSITAPLKNAIDWASREESDDEPSLVAYTGKVAAICSASPGALGGLRGLVTLRSILSNIGVLVLPNQVTVSTAHEAFDENGQLKDARKAKQLAGLVARLVEVAGKLKS